MPALDVLLLLLVFCVPGAIGVAAWDLRSNYPDRPLWSTIAFGFLWTLLVYALLESLGVIHLGQLFSGDKFDYKALTAWKNIAFFLVLTASSSIAGIGAGMWAPEWLPRWFFGKSLKASTWTTLFESISTKETWLRVRTKSGYFWIGRAHLVPTTARADDILVLREAECHDIERAEFVKQDARFVVIPVADIEYLQVDQPPPAPPFVNPPPPLSPSEPAPHERKEESTAVQGAGEADLSPGQLPRNDYDHNTAEPPAASPAPEKAVAPTQAPA